MSAKFYESVCAKQRSVLAKLWAIEGAMLHDLDLDLLESVAQKYVSLGKAPLGYGYPELS